jgi:hypothetical protein
MKKKTKPPKKEKGDDVVTHVFCEHCGVRIAGKPELVGFHQMGGWRRYRLLFKCPNWRWWRRGHSWGYKHRGTFWADAKVRVYDEETLLAAGVVLPESE